VERHIPLHRGKTQTREGSVPQRAGMPQRRLLGLKRAARVAGAEVR
jgi:hypothetical protein